MNPDSHVRYHREREADLARALEHRRDRDAVSSSPPASRRGRLERLRRRRIAEEAPAAPAPAP